MSETSILRARALGLAAGKLPPGDHNSIADVPGVAVGHHTIAEGELRTGVTAILPHGGDVFRDKPVAAAWVLNGFGKSIGLMQVEELGQLETPILLTNTLSVGTCGSALIRRAIAANPEIGRRTSTVNPVVCECNDGFLSDIQALAVTEADANAALDAAAPDFASGAVGAGAGMSCFGFKGGIGTASRRVRIGGADHHFGVLLLANFGRAGDLRLPDGRRVDPQAAVTPENGSVIVVIATDVPLDHRQLRRVIRRAGAGLAWAGSFWGHQSGDLSVGFTTANRVAHDSRDEILPFRMLNEERLDLLFQAAAEATQEAVYDALAAADTTRGRAGHVRLGLRHALGRPG
jgi:D-aminopeptidase